MGARRIVIGCGALERGDDAAGLLVARLLRKAGIEAREHSGEALSLLEEWNGAGEVILIDAVVTGSPVARIFCWDNVMPSVARGAFRCSTHELGVAEAVELARCLGRLPPRLIIYGIEGVRFGLGDPVSPEVACAVEAVAREIARR